MSQKDQALLATTVESLRSATQAGWGAGSVAERFTWFCQVQGVAKVLAQRFGGFEAATSPSPNAQGRFFLSLETDNSESSSTTYEGSQCVPVSGGTLSRIVWGVHRHLQGLLLQCGGGCGRTCHCWDWSSYLSQCIHALQSYGAGCKKGEGTQNDSALRPSGAWLSSRQ